ncbi:response regulator [Candidatus Contubernalis alkaliaceticus]|uniref:response regulator n=1 Tax=Candidatus Contubernalis alkaliaceticus TaxID=338645 RepID=UPI001F4C0B13|nr:response regulator [Candidatus Contubernalis alkalaceticus]UNC92036.1 response regulator [Candidatus Contubernalis alkalaceticus]
MIIIAELLSAHLSKFGFVVYRCEKFSNILSEFEKEQPHLVLLDVNLPSFDVFYWCAKLCTKSSCPILFLSSRNSDSDQVFAISNGGDDYITKPFSFEVVTAKVNAQLRRVYGEYANAIGDKLACGDCYFSQSKLLLKCGNNSNVIVTISGPLRKRNPNFPLLSPLLTIIFLFVAVKSPESYSGKSFFSGEYEPFSLNRTPFREDIVTFHKVLKY